MKAQVVVIALLVASLTGLTALVAVHTHSGALGPVLWWLSYAGFLPFGVGAACGLTKSHHLVVLVTIVLVLVVAPDGVLALCRALVPVGVGMLLGRWARIGLREEHRERPAA
jgi:hypothetical protein